MLKSVNGTRERGLIYSDRRTPSESQDSTTSAAAPEGGSRPESCPPLVPRPKTLGEEQRVGGWAEGPPPILCRRKRRRRGEIDYRTPGGRTVSSIYPCPGERWQCQSSRGRDAWSLNLLPMRQTLTRRCSRHGYLPSFENQAGAVKPRHWIYTQGSERGSRWR